MLITRLYLGKVFLRLDQPLMALDIYHEASETYKFATAPLLAMARLYEELNDLSKSLILYKKVFC